jgi:thiol-disulfide isomerase/thioredoxin
MKSIIFILIVMLTALFSCKTGKPLSQAEAPAVQQAEQPAQHVNYSDASTWIIGYFKVNRLSQEPHSAWFVKGMDEYSGNRQAIDSLKAINKEYLSVKIVMGTWCPDSRREVPRFMRVLKEIDFPAERVSFIGVDNVKFSPIDNYDALGIERVPTFIFYKNNVEAGRIIENPATSLEQDMLNILARNEKF